MVVPDPRERAKAYVRPVFVRARPHRGERRARAGQLARAAGFPHSELRHAGAGT